MRIGKSGWNQRNVRTRSTVDQWIRTHISNVITSEGDQATLRVGGLRGGLRGVSTSGDEHLISPNLSKEVIRLFMIAIAVFDTGDTRFDSMKVSEVGEPLSCLRDKVGKGRLRVFHLHSLPVIPRGDAESDSIFPNDLGNGFEDFEWEPGTVLNRSTVFVCPLVRSILEELVREISVGEMELNSVESGTVDGSVGGVCVPLDVGFDLFDCHGTGGRVGRGHGDGGRADQFKAGVLGLERVKLCGATESPKLEENVRAIGVDCVYYLRGGGVRQYY
jgi:hypothetical protein